MEALWWRERVACSLSWTAPAVEFMAVPTDGEGVYDAQRATWTEKRLAGIRKKMKEEAEEKKK